MFLAPALDSHSQKRLTEIKEKMGSLERVLEEDVAKKPQKRRSKHADRRRHSAELPGQEDSSSDEGHVPEDEKGLEMTPMAAIDAAYENDADEEILDLGIRVGKMRLTERLGGFFRPKLSDEISYTLNDPSRDYRSSEEKAAATHMSPSTAEGFLEPGPTYLAPNSAFVIGDIGSRRTFMDFLPSKQAADSLIDRYYEQVHLVAKVVHWPTFQTQYDNFWANVLMGVEPAASTQALVFAVMFSAVASMTEGDTSATFSRPKRSVVSNFQTGTEVTLGKAHFLRTTKIETLQALVVYLIPMCRAEISRAHSVLVGMAIRLGECLGLHRDPALVYNRPPVDCQVRRTLWFQLCFLDFRTAEAQGPRPGIRREDYDTHFPLSINDSDLMFARPKEVENTWTDTTFTRIRFECNEMHRVVWFDRIRLEKKQVSLTHVLGKLESFKKAMEAKYHSFLDERVPIQRLAKLVLSVLLTRMHIMVLHRYHNSVHTRIPDRLRQVILTNGTQGMEDAVKVETIPELSPWRWYAGVYQQWATAFLLLVEVYNFPMRKEAERIWAIADYVFEPDRSLSRAQKGRDILGDLADRLAIYRDIRKLRAPVSMALTSDLKTKVPGVMGKMPTASKNFDKPTAMAPCSADTSGPTSAKSPQSISSPEHSQGISPPSDSAQNSFHSWSFDSPATFYLGPQSKLPTSPMSSQTAAAMPPVSNLEPPSQPYASGSSPSEISTADSWPPFISSQQQSWGAPWPDASAADYAMQFQMASSGFPQTSGAGEVSQPFAVIDAPMNNGTTNSSMVGKQTTDPMALDINWVSLHLSTRTCLPTCMGRVEIGANVV